jgi:hypothetical protein
MTKSALIFILFHATFSQCTLTAQSLLGVEWNKVVCADGIINQAYSVCNDSSGNTFTLSSFKGKSSCQAQSVQSSSGAYLISKLDKNGLKSYISNLGGTDVGSDADMKLCRNGNIVLGLNFEDSFFLHGNFLAHAKNSSGIILKLDSNLNLKWYRTFHAKSSVTVARLLIDNANNIYALINSGDSLLINGKIYSQSTGYATALLKFRPDGAVLWSHYYNSDYTMTSRVMEMGTLCDSCPPVLMISGHVHGDSLYIDGKQTIHDYGMKYTNQYYCSTIDTAGTIINTRFIESAVRSIVNIVFSGTRIFCAGSYTDTLRWNGKQHVPRDNTSLFIAELDYKSEIKGFNDLKANMTTEMTSFAICPVLGFVISGTYDDSFSLLSHFTYHVNGERSSFIASLDSTMSLNNLKHIQGGYYRISAISLQNGYFTGMGTFSGKCYFKGQDCFAYNSDISVFRTTFAQYLDSSALSTDAITSTSGNVILYPNPFEQSFRLIGNVFPGSLTVINATGTECHAEIKYINDSELMVCMDNLADGVYVIRYLTPQGIPTVQKILKQD